MTSTLGYLGGPNCDHRRPCKGGTVQTGQGPSRKCDPWRRMLALALKTEERAGGRGLRRWELEGTGYGFSPGAGASGGRVALLTSCFGTCTLFWAFDLTNV